jgi:hypothetical protein
MIKDVLRPIYRNPTWTPAILFNFASQALRPNAKIFFIGFNKCGTTAIHRLMRNSGIRSVHWEHNDENIAVEIEKRVHCVNELRYYLRRWTAYSDISYSTEERCIDGNRYFRTLAAAYPEGFFVLNDRDEDRWIKSRLSHRKGTYLARAIKRLGKTEAEIIDLWRHQFREHRAEVLEFFGNAPNFLHFRIDADDIQALVNFLRPSYSVDKTQWGTVNRTKRQAENYVGR